jgi:hypothetical protein
MSEEEGLSDDTKAIVASNLVSVVALLRAHRWAEGDAKTYALKLYNEFRAQLDQS